MSDVQIAYLTKQLSYLRIIRVTKFFKIIKYKSLVFKIIGMLQLKPTQSRILVILCMAMIMVHIFACSFYLTARIDDFHANTWVIQRGELNIS